MAEEKDVHTTAQETGSQEEPQQSNGWTLKEFGGKTVWDWLQLLLVPLVLGIVAAGLTAWFNAQQNARQQEIEAHRAKSAQAIAELQRQYTTVQEYMDKMTELILSESGGGLRNSNEESDLRVLARARTLTALDTLDGVRKRAVVTFLYEAHLLTASNAIVDISGADLRDAQLQDNPYVGIDLHGTSLYDGEDKAQVGALLYNCDLRDANLLDANLVGADLSNTRLNDGPDEDKVGAVLKRANLSNADLTNAKLTNADLQDANLSEADLTVTTLTHANLEGAFKVTKDKTVETIPNEELEAQAWSLEGATMPNGQKYEDWLEDQ